MPAFICTTCGTQFPPSASPPDGCAICQEERQYVNPLGQTWATPEQMRRTHRNAFTQHEPGLIGIGTMPNFGIGQRALLLRLPSGNFLWDCVSLVDEATVEIVGALGGIAGIAISHPHYYAAMVDWSHAFEGAPIHLHAADRQGVMRPDPAIQFWEEQTRQLAPGLTLIRAGGHFAGGTILHWASGAGGKGALLSGDILQVGPDQRLSFMRSYPDYIPLDASTVQAMAEKVAPWSFDAIYGAWWDRVIPTGGKAAMDYSVRRYIAAVTAPPVERDPD